MQIWIQNAKITLWKNFGQIFRFHRFWSSGPGMRKKVISQYKLYFKMYGIYINLGCKFEFRTQKLPYERISGNFSDFIDFGHQVRICEKISFLNISCNSKIWDLHKFGLQIEFRTQKLPYERISGNFFDFIDFGHQVRVCEKRSFLNISFNSKYIGFTYIWVADLNSERKNYPMKEFRAIFPISSILVIRSAYAKKSQFSILAVFQNVWDLHKFGLQIWIQNAKITLWKNFGHFFRFHRFWSSGPGMQKTIIFQY